MSDSGKAPLNQRRRYPTDRTAAISDGVFAVALTLLILDVKLPDRGTGELAKALISVAPRLGIFALSFAIVAYYWVVHHLIFVSMRGVSVGLLWANFAFLFAIVVLPFSTAVLGIDALAPPALALYGLNLAACTTTLTVAWYVAERGDLIEQLLPKQRRYIVLRLTIQVLVALFGVVCAFVSPVLALAIFVAFPVIYALSYRRRYY
jgi:uncharacterized membrane protein